MDQSRIARMLLPVVFALLGRMSVAQSSNLHSSLNEHDQSSALVVIDVKDASQAPIFAASIKWKNLETGLSADGKVNSTGTMTMALPYGSYEFVVSSPGFKTTKERVEINDPGSVALAVQLAASSVCCGSCLEITNPADHLTLGQPSIKAKLEPSTGTILQMNLPATRVRKPFSHP